MLTKQKCSAFAFGALTGLFLMYVFDPTSGRRRRTIAKDKFKSFVKNAYKYRNKKIRHLMNKAEGFVAKTHHRVDEFLH